MRLWRTVISCLAAGLLLSACATVPKSGQPQPSDHLKAEAGHLAYAVWGALNENEREVLAAYSDVRILYLDAQREAPEQLEASAAFDASGASGVAGTEKSIVRILTRKEALELGEEAPPLIKKLRDYLKDGDILVSMTAVQQKADENTGSENLLLAFRRANGNILLVAAAMN